MPENTEAFQLMMDALDGEISDNGRKRLQYYLDTDADLAKEWTALNEIDDLFKSTPVIEPAIDFAQRTIGRLPNPKLRRRLIRGIYAILVLSGILPVLLLIWGFSRLSVNDSEILNTIFRALGDGVTVLVAGLGTRLIEQPALFIPLVLMGLSVFAWRTVYARLTKV